MRAVVFERFGEPADVLSVRDVPLSEPQAGEVRVRMIASPINPSDLMSIRGVYGKLPQLPATPGFEGVGIVEAAGRGLLPRFFLGKRVVVVNRDRGNWCEKTVVPARQVIPIPADLPVEQAAMFFVNPVAAYVMTRRILAVAAGEWLLQTAAGSSLGQMVIRLGKRYGFRTLNVVRRAEQIGELRSIGADAVLAFDPNRDHADRLRDEVRNITNSDGVRYAIDPVGGGTGSALVSCLGPGGRMLVYGTLSSEPLSFSPRALMTPGASIEGFWLSRWILTQRLVGKLRLVKTITRLIRDGVLRSEVGRTYRLEEINEAVREAQKPARGGKVLLRMSD